MSADTYRSWIAERAAAREQRLRALEDAAARSGVCLKIVSRTRAPERLDACRRPTEDGSRFCRMHRYGV